MDLVGIDVGFEVARSFSELSFGEPRWRPSPIQARMVAAGRLGRKSGRGYYDYTGEGPHRPADPESPPTGGADGKAVVIAGGGPLAEGLRARAADAGYEVRSGGATDLTVDAGLGPSADPPEGAAVLSLCAGSSLAARGRAGAVGFHLVPPLDACGLVELTRPRDGGGATADAAERFFTHLGFATAWVGDGPGLVLGRIVCQLVNEACFAVGEGVGHEQDVDAGLTLGLNHPRGPFEWLEAIGVEHVCAVCDALWRERREERYRIAPELWSRAMLAGWRPLT